MSAADAKCAALLSHTADAERTALLGHATNTADAKRAALLGHATNTADGLIRDINYPSAIIQRHRHEFAIFATSQESRTPQDACPVCQELESCLCR